MTESIAIGKEEEGKKENTSPCIGHMELSSEGAMAAVAAADTMSRKDRRKVMKKEKRKQIRKEQAEKARQEEEALLNDPEEQRRIQFEEERERERAEREGREFEEAERLFLDALAARRKAEQEEEERKALQEEEEKTKQNQILPESELNEDDNYEYVEEGPPEIIWQGNEIIVKKKKVRVKKKDVGRQTEEVDADRPISNPLPPDSEAFSDYKNATLASAQELLENVAQQIPNFGTEQDKAHCPFHLKTGACRFGSRCSRVHFYPDKSCTLLMRNMYNGPGLAWEQDEGLEYTDEEVERSYEEFYEDVHTEFLKFGEIVNFKVCRNGSFHLRGNVYVHYRSLDSAVLAFHSINGRYFAGKQVKSEFVNVTKWKVAICGEYMKSRLKSCSHGSACNFIHCFRNPGGDYEWADWDKQPPKYWVKKMAVLFGDSDKSGYEKSVEHESSGHLKNSSKMLSTERDRYYLRRSLSRETDHLDRTSRRHQEEHDLQSQHRRRRNKKLLNDKSRNDKDNKKRTRDTTDSDQDWSDKDKRGHSGSPRKRSRQCIKESDSQNYHGARKNTSYHSNSDEDLFDRCREKDEYHSRRRRTLEHRNKLLDIHDNFGCSKNRHQGIGSSRDWLEENRHTNRYQRGKKKDSWHQSNLSVSPDDFYEHPRSTQDTDMREDWSDGDRERNHARSRKQSLHFSESLYLHDDPGKSEVLDNKFLQNDSESDKSELHSLKKYDHSSRNDHVDTEINVDVPNENMKCSCIYEICNSGRCDHRFGSCVLDSTVYASHINNDELCHHVSGKGPSKNHKKSTSACSGGENSDFGSHCKNNGRSKSRDSDDYEDVDKRGRWEPEKGISEYYDSDEEHEVKQFTPKCNSGNLKSLECYPESRSRSRSSHRRRF